MEEHVRASVAGVPGSCESHDVGAENGTWVLGENKSSLYSEPLLQLVHYLSGGKTK